IGQVTRICRPWSVAACVGVGLLVAVAVVPTLDAFPDAIFVRNHAIQIDAIAQGPEQTAFRGWAREVGIVGGVRLPQREHQALRTRFGVGGAGAEPIVPLSLVTATKFPSADRGDHVVDVTRDGHTTAASAAPTASAAPCRASASSPGTTRVGARSSLVVASATGAGPPTRAPARPRIATGSIAAPARDRRSVV